MQLESSNRELKESQQQLIQSEKMASLDQLVAGIAHEINNPLGFVKSNIGNIKKFYTKLFKLIESFDRLELSEETKEKLKVESSPGKGSTFRLTLPVNPQLNNSAKQQQALSRFKVVTYGG